MTLTIEEQRARFAKQMAEALELEARGIKPYVPDILFTEGVFASREEYDEIVRTAPIIPYEIARLKPARKARGRAGA